MSLLLQNLYREILAVADENGGQLNIFGGFAPASQIAVEMSKALGSRTVMSGSISRGKNDPSQSLQMMERPLMPPDEFKAMPKGEFIIMKTGVHPTRIRLRLFLDWGIKFLTPYEVPERGHRPVAYADKQELEEAITRSTIPEFFDDEFEETGNARTVGGMLQAPMQGEPLPGDPRRSTIRT